MRSTEYFQGVKGWPDYPLRGEGSIRVEDHPLSDSEYKLASGTKYIQLFTYLGDPARVPTQQGQRPFWEQTFPDKSARGPIITLDEYEEVLSSVGEDFRAGGVLLSPNEGEWVDYPTEPVIYSSTLSLVSGIEVPQDENNRQIRAVSVFNRHAPADIRQYPGTKFTDELQSKGFSPDAFNHLEHHARRMHVPAQIIRSVSAVLEALGQPGATVVGEAATKGAQGIVKSMIPHGNLREIVRTSRHSA